MGILSTIAGILGKLFAPLLGVLIRIGKEHRQVDPAGYDEDLQNHIDNEIQDHIDSERKEAD